MRPLGLILMFAACGGGGDGAVLSFTAPDGPGTASRIELVLASADTRAMTSTRQRTRPRDQAQEPVVYYRQRSHVDAIVGISAVDGFEVRIEPDETVVDDETFIPFALMYDAQDALIGVGTVNDENGLPMPVIVKSGIVAVYKVTVIKIAPDADSVGIKTGQGHAVSCQSDAGSWRSGVVWKPVGVPQIRLLLPDLAEDPDATDAMLRASDLDCDEHPADSRDCDDLRSAYHSDQQETCDGDDTDCDGRALELIRGCTAGAGSTCVAPGVSLCSEGSSDNALDGVCTQSAACGCELINNTRPAGCRACALTWTEASGSGNPGSGGAEPCSPGAGKLHFDPCVAPGCTLDVVGADGPWEIKIAATETGTFGAQLTGVTVGQFYLRARYLGTTAFPNSATTLGGAYIAITTALGGRKIMPINLELQDAAPQAQCTFNPAGNNLMTCTL